jgi:opacity protein-like surface antigen
MKNKKMMFIIGLGILTCAGAQAQSTDLYSSHEWNVDTYGFYAGKDKGGNKDAWGIGLGGSYFFTRNIGAGADTYMDAFTVPYLLNANGIFRYPIGQSRLAPYGFGGFGRQWDHAAQLLGHVGVGLEYRFKPTMGAFFDAREVFPTETKDYAVLRFGFRFVFK